MKKYDIRLLIMSISPMDVSSVFWSFVRTICDMKSRDRQHAMDVLFRTYSPTEHCKIHMSVLHNVEHFDVDMPIPITWTPDNFLLFHNLSDLLKGISIIYAYQEDSWHKNAMGEMHEWLQQTQEMELVHMIESMVRL